MKKITLTVLFSMLSLPALADHSLESIMKDNAKLNTAIKAIESAADIVCNVADTTQDFYYKKEKRQAGTAFKQVVKCSKDKTLTVGYKWVEADSTAGDVIYINLK